MFSPRFCRACACGVNEACEIVNNPAKPELPLLLKRYVPEFNIKVENACLCFDCVSTLYSFHNFKRKCLHTEENLRLHIRKHPEVTTANLNDIFAPKEQTNNGLSLETNAILEETIEPPSAAIPEEAIKEKITEPTFRKCLRTQEDLRLHIRKHPQVEKVNLNDSFALKETYNTIDDIELSLETAVIPKRSVTNETGQPPSETVTATTSAAIARRIVHCETCLLVFPSAKDLHFHYRKHHGRRRYQCDKCSRDFALEKAYHEHLEYHKRPGAGRFTCKICNFVYQWKHCLTKHNFSKHLSDDKKSFQCEVCAMRFVEKEALLEHMRTHTGDRLYNCSVCDKYATTSIKELDKHIKAMHNVDSKF